MFDFSTESSERRADAHSRIAFCLFGVSIELEYERAEFGDAEICSRMERIFPRVFEESAADGTVRRHFRIFKDRAAENPLYKLYCEKEFTAAAFTKEQIFDYLDSQIRLSVAELAVGKVFIHAGVVGWKGRAVVLPGTSFHGKTTLVAELVRCGAEYFSDEYAVLDAEGRVHPFPKRLSVRGIIGDYEQVDLPVEHFGGKAAEKPLPAGLILFTNYSKEADWNPQPMTPGEAVMEIISHAFSIRYKPEFVLKVLNKVVNRAIITKTPRGEASIFAHAILEMLEDQQ